MDRLMRAGAALAIATGMAASQAVAQTTVFVSGGLTVPTGDYAEYANSGWMAQGGVAFEVGPPGLSIGGSAFYGVNNHEPPPDGDKTNLYGALAFLLYTIGDAAALSPYVFGGPGFMTHSYKSETSPERSDSGLAAAVGGGVNIPLGGILGYVEGMYMTGFGDEVDGTDLFGVSVGASFPVGG